MSKKSIKFNPEKINKKLDRVFNKKSFEEKLLENLYVKLFLGIAPVVTFCVFLYSMLVFLPKNGKMTMTELSTFCLSGISGVVIVRYYFHVASIKIKDKNDLRSWEWLFYLCGAYAMILLWFQHIWPSGRVTDDKNEGIE